MSRKAPLPVSQSIPANSRIAIVAARSNSEIVDLLLQGCVERLNELGITENRIAIHRVPGAFELPLAAQWLARTGRYSAIICLGAVVRGQTPHFDFVAGQAAAGIARVALDEDLPVIFGVLTTNTPRQARDRAGGSHGHAGIRAAEAAVEMIALRRKMRNER